MNSGEVAAGAILRHNFFADFIVFDSVILEVKAKEGIANDESKNNKLSEMLWL